MRDCEQAGDRAMLRELLQQAARLRRAGRRAASSTPRRTRGWSPTPSATTAIMYYGGAESLEPARHAHVRDARAPARGRAAPTPKAVVWAHNSHIGDARHTEMGAVRGELNIGQLCRERFGDEAALIGFGTHSGTVAAASDWDGADGDQARAALASRTATSGCATTPASPRFLLDLRAGRHEALRAACSSRGWSASSASSTGPRPSAGATTPRRRCRSSSTPMSGSTRRRRSRPWAGARQAGRARHLSVRAVIPRPCLQAERCCGV